MAMVFSSVGFTPDDFPTSHGLKATLLAWVCKFGINKEAREALGYHVGCPKPGTVQVYARVRIEEPLAQLCNMLVEIQTDRFNPDTGDMLTWHMAKKTAGEAEKRDVGIAVGDSSIESSSDSSSSDSSSDADPQWEAKRILTELGPKPVLKELCVHLATRKVHRLKLSGEFTACGRRLSGMYAQADSFEPPNSACLVCFADNRADSQADQ